MDKRLQAVRDKRTGAVLFYKRFHPPFKVDPHRIDSSKNSFVDVLPSQNERVTVANFRDVAATERVSLNFGNNYGFRQNYLLLEENVPSANIRNIERSKKLGEVALQTATAQTLKDIRSLSQDVYKLSFIADMLNQFDEQNLL